MCPFGGAMGADSALSREWWAVGGRVRGCAPRAAVGSAAEVAAEVSSAEVPTEVASAGVAARVTAGVAGT